MKDLSDVSADEDQPFAVTGTADDVSPRAQAHVDAGSFLFEAGVAHHAQLGGRTGDIVHPLADFKAGIAGTVAAGVCGRRRSRLRFVVAEEHGRDGAGAQEAPGVNLELHRFPLMI